MRRSQSGEALARLAVQQLTDCGFFEKLEDVSLGFPRDPRRLVTDVYKIEIIEYDFSKPRAEALYICDGIPYLGIRTKDAEEVQNFSILHGVVHWLIHQDKAHYDGKRMDWRLELQANTGATAGMVPEDEFECIAKMWDLHTIRSVRDMIAVYDKLLYIAKYFGVSIYVICWRLVDMKYVEYEVVSVFLQGLYHYSA